MVCGDTGHGLGDGQCNSKSVSICLLYVVHVVRAYGACNCASEGTNDEATKLYFIKTLVCHACKHKKHRCPVMFHGPSSHSLHLCFLVPISISIPLVLGDLGHLQQLQWEEQGLAPQ